MNKTAFCLWSCLWTAAILMASVLVLAQLAPNFHANGGGDYHQYSQMTRTPLNNTAAAPWCYRPLLPALAGGVARLGLPLPRAFLVVSALAALLSCVAFACLVRNLGFSPSGAILGGCLFAASCGGFGAIQHYGYPDALTNLFLVLSFSLLYSGRPVGAAMVIAVGVVAKESLLLVVPAVIFLSRKARRPVSAATLILCPLLAYVTLRVVIPGGQGQSFFSASNMDGVAQYWKSSMRHGEIRWCLWALTYSLGPLWLLAALNGRAGRKHLWHLSAYLIMLVLPLALTTDTNRALCLAFPAVIPVALCGWERFRHSRRTYWTMGVVTITATFVCASTYYWTSMWKYVFVPLLCVLPAAWMFVFRRQAVPGYEMVVHPAIAPLIPFPTEWRWGCLPGGRRPPRARPD